MAMYNVTIAVPVRVKVNNVEAASHKSAIETAEDLVAPELDQFLTLSGSGDDGKTPSIVYAEPDEDVSHYIVDVHGDEEYSQTMPFEPDNITNDGGVVVMDRGTTQFERMKAVLEQFASAWKEGERTQTMDWDELQPVFEKCVKLMGSDRIAAMEYAQKYFWEPGALESPDDDAFFVVRQGAGWFDAVLPSDIGGHKNQTFTRAEDATAYIEERSKTLDPDGEYPVFKHIFDPYSRTGIK